MKTTKKVSLAAFVALLLAICILPCAALLAGYEAENRENRPLANMPSLVTRGEANLEYPAEFDNYFSDRFGFREEMVTAFNSITLAVFGDTLNEKVIVGREGFLFYSETLDDYLNTAAMSGDDILRAATALRLVGDYCVARGMAFAFGVAPNKNSIYPEYMPARYAPAGGEGNRERLYAALKEAGVESVNFAALLINAKAEGLLYHIEDTHWNERGALIAYRAIMAAVAGGAEYDAYPGLEPETLYDGGGDLHNFILPAREGKAPRPYYGIAEEYALDEGVRIGRDATLGTTSGKNGLSLVIYRDSFGNALLPLISSNAGRAVYSSAFPYDLTLTSGADGVFIELVERNLKNLAVSAPLMPADECALPEGAFAAEATVMERRTSGYTQLYGWHVGAAGRVFIEFEAGGTRRVFEAFPVMDEAALKAAEDAASPCGGCFVLTLPEGDYGEYTARVKVLPFGE